MLGEPVKLPSLLVGWVTNKDIAKVCQSNHFQNSQLADIL
jgi:hypothetical protein